MTTVGKIYSDNCIHCKKMAKDWEKMKKHVSKLGGGDVDVREFETTKDAAELDKYKTELKEKYGGDLTYDGVPSLFKVDRNGKIEYYGGERSEKALTNWALEQDKNVVAGGSKKRVKTRKQNRKTGKKINKRRTKKKSSCGFW